MTFVFDRPYRLETPWRRGCYRLSQQLEVGIVSTSALCTSSSFSTWLGRGWFAVFWWAVDRISETGRACMYSRYRRRLQRQSSAHWWLVLVGCAICWHVLTWSNTEWADTQPWKHTRSCDNSIYLSFEQFPCWTHRMLLVSLVVCSLSLAIESLFTVERLVHGWRHVNQEAVQRMLDVANFPSHNLMTSMSTSCSHCKTPSFGTLPIYWRDW